MSGLGNRALLATNLKGLEIMQERCLLLVIMQRTQVIEQDFYISLAK